VVPYAVQYSKVASIYNEHRTKMKKNRMRLI